MKYPIEECGKIEQYVLYVLEKIRPRAISSYMLTRELNSGYAERRDFTRQQVSGALQRLRKDGLVKHFGGWSLRMNGEGE